MTDYYDTHNHGSRMPVHISLHELTNNERSLLIDSDVFCILPWIHLHAFPNGDSFPCCMADSSLPVGSMRDNTMEEIFHNDEMQRIRRSMIIEKSCGECRKCYEQERNGFFSMRNSANQNFGHNIKNVTLNDDGTTDDFKIRYYDIRFSNLCNLACRSCGDIFSSNWVKEKKQYGWLPKDHPNVSYAGKHKLDAWEQLLPHILYLEEIYFAGGEPLIMAEHYRLLKELIRQKRTDVRLIYNTNFSELMFKGENTLDLWNYFDKVSVGASLDASYSRGELMRYGTDWNKIVHNRIDMLVKSPQVDFYISSTLSVMNAIHLPTFHREWVELGLITPMDFNINILQGPEYYRIDILPDEIKADIRKKYEAHIEWLEPLDEYNRAVNGFKSALTFMDQQNNTHLIQDFLTNIDKLDRFRDERFFNVFPELLRLKKYER